MTDSAHFGKDILVGNVSLRKPTGITAETAVDIAGIDRIMLDVNWNALYGFWQVAKKGSFASAARTLPRGSIQALHKRIRRLEAEENLNLKLLRSRGMKGVELTDAGRCLLEVLDPFFSSLESLVVDLRGEDRGSLILAMTPYSAYNYASDILRTFHTVYPGVSVSVWVRDTRDVIELVESGDVHFGICPPPSRSTRLRTEARVALKFELIAQKNHPLSNSRVTWAAVVNHPMVLLQPTFIIRQAFDKLVERQGLLAKLTIASELATPELAVDAVRAGMGVALIPVGPRLTEQLRNLARIQPPSGLPKIEVAVLSREDRYLPRYMRAFVEKTKRIINRARN